MPIRRERGREGGWNGGPNASPSRPGKGIDAWFFERLDWRRRMEILNIEDEAAETVIGTPFISFVRGVRQSRGSGVPLSMALKQR